MHDHKCDQLMFELLVSFSFSAENDLTFSVSFRFRAENEILFSAHFRFRPKTNKSFKVDLYHLLFYLVSNDDFIIFSIVTQLKRH